MVCKKSKWAAHLKAAESSGLSLMAYATKHEFDVRRLYEARQLRKLQGATAWSVVRVKEQAAVEVVPKVQHWVTPSTIAMQARLGNGVVLSWDQDQTNTPALDSVLRPCHVPSERQPGGVLAPRQSGLPQEHQRPVRGR